MTEEQRYKVKYFDRELLKTVYEIVSDRFKKDGEPLPPFSTATEENIESFINTPQLCFFGVEVYPTVEAKASIIFYTLNKKHIFQNGNKRMSVACLIIFLILNKKRPVLSEDELTKKALWLAQTTHTHNFHQLKENLENWIKDELLKE